MKKINFKSRLAKQAIAGLAVLAVASGASYAWWYTTASVGTDIQMGNLNLETNFSQIEVRAYEPGDEVSSTGTVQNTGNIASAVSIKEDTQIGFQYADDAFNPWTGAEWVPDADNAVKTDFSSADGYGYNLDAEGNVIWCWFVNRNDSSDKYLLLAPGGKIDLGLHADFDGDIMTNRYQNALIKIVDNLEATQTMDGAMTSLFGLTYDDLDIYWGPDMLRTLNTVPESVMKQIEAMFHR